MSPVGGHRPTPGQRDSCRSNRFGERGSGMQINGGGKHHALTKFYLDKSVDTRHRDEAVIYIYTSGRNTATN